MGTSLFNMEAVLSYDLGWFQYARPLVASDWGVCDWCSIWGTLLAKLKYERLNVAIKKEHQISRFGVG